MTDGSTAWRWLRGLLLALVIAATGLPPLGMVRAAPTMDAPPSSADGTASAPSPLVQRQERLRASGPVDERTTASVAVVPEDDTGRTDAPMKEGGMPPCCGGERSGCCTFVMTAAETPPAPTMRTDRHRVPGPASGREASVVEVLPPPPRV